MGYRIAIVGAPGLLTSALVGVLDRRNFPIDELAVYAEQPEQVSGIYRGHSLAARSIPPDVFKGNDIAFLFGGSALSRHLVEGVTEKNCLVVDNSAHGRARRDIPLGVPEVNPAAIRSTTIVANPTCTSIQLATILKPVDGAAQVLKAIVATYQAVSGSGAPGVADLQAQVRASVANEPLQPAFYPDCIAFNVIPHIGDFSDDGYTTEEATLASETARLLDSDIRISATCVRVPVLRAHSQAVHIETKQHLSTDDVRELLTTAPGLRVANSCRPGGYPMPSTATGEDLIYVGRIRGSTVVENGITFWSVMDQIYKGSVLNAVQIAELVFNVQASAASRRGRCRTHSSR